MDDMDASSLRSVKPADLFTARTSITLVTRIGSLAGEIPADVTSWLTRLAAVVDDEIRRR